MTSGIVIKLCRPGLLGLVILLLAFLYPGGAALGDVQVVPHTVRVGLAQNLTQVSFNLQGNYRLVNINTGQVIAGEGKGHWTVEYAGGLCRVLRDGEYIGLYNGPIKAESRDAAVKTILSGDGTMLHKDSPAGLAVQGAAGDVDYLNDDRVDLYILDENAPVKQSSGSRLNIAGLEKGGEIKHYRGNLEVRAAENGLTVINELPIEQYLYGVIPAEMPVSFPVEALKAQSVVARSYLITQLGSYGSYGFDVLDSQSNQVYRGYDGENPATNMAVDATKGMVLVHRGRPIAAFFHASSGGYTENSEDVWSDSLSFIRSKEDPLDFNDKHYNWSVTYSGDELVALLNRQLKKYIGTYKELIAITDLRELEYTASGQRVKKLMIEGIDASGGMQVYTVFNADRVRYVLGLNSALFTMRKETGPGDVITRVTFTGSGLGHGLGMSQYGAAGWAAQGYSFQDILQYYYTDVELADNYGM